MKKVLAITTITNTLSLKDALEKIKRDYGDIILLKKIYLEDYEDPQVFLKEFKEDIESSHIILVDIRGDERIGRELITLLKGEPKTVVTLVWGNPLIMNLTSLGPLKVEELSKNLQSKGVDLEAMVRSYDLKQIIKHTGEDQELKKHIQNWFKIREYYSQNDADNLKNMLLFLLREYGNMENINSIDPPKEMPPYGLYLPYRGIYLNLKDYKKVSQFKQDKPTVGVLFYGGMHFDDTRPMAEALYEKLQDKANLIIAFSQVEHNLKVLDKYLADIDLFVNLQYFQLNGGPMGGDPKPTHEFFQQNNIPYLISLRGYETDIHKWSQKEGNLNPMEIILGVTLPELDGGIEPIFTSALENLEEKDMGMIKIISVLDERMDKLSQRILNWLQLKYKKNASKKIAILTYNYPPGEENLASSGYLDVFKSMESFLEKLKQRNYHLNIPSLPVKELFLEANIVNSPHYTNKSGIKIPVAEYQSWFKKLPLNIQESVISSWGEVPGDIMVEDKYLLIPGVELGNIFIGVQPSRGIHEDMENAYHDKELPPHHQYLAFYYYIEKLFQADALIHFGMHGTLEFTPGKEVALSANCYPDILIGNVPHIYYYWVGNTSESTIAKRRSYAICISHASPPMQSSEIYEDYLVLEELLRQYHENNDETTLQIIQDKADELNLKPDIKELNQELYRMKRRLIPMGLHVLDENLEKEELVDYLLGVLRIDREHPSILKLISQNKGLVWNDIKNTPISEEIELEAKELIYKILNEEENLPIEPEYCDYVKNLSQGLNFSRESKALLDALEGSYILPARGGDPIRDPEVYPTGRSMFAFDPREIPTISAQVRGISSAEILIQSYLNKHGKYPQSVGIVLWGFETMKTGGDTIATILHLMGMKIKHQKGAWIKNLEVIPLEELGRPRIDVTINICGIFRDTLGTHIDLINRSIKKVAHLDEPPEWNYIRKHFQEEEGDFSLARIYGPAPTEYATSMRSLIENSNWEEEQELVDSYSDSMSYAYLPGKIERDVTGFKQSMQKVDIVTQERDNVEYEVTDLDHYFEFLGGLARTVEDLKGEQAEIMVTDTTEDELYVEDLSATINRATRTRLLNPKWLEGMLNHDFHGSKKIKDRLEHLLGFSATTGKVDNWLYDNVAEKLIFDDTMREKLQENNPYATIKMGELLLETESRGYWEADPEKIKKLKDIVMDLETEVE